MPTQPAIQPAGERRRSRIADPAHRGRICAVCLALCLAACTPGMSGCIKGKVARPVSLEEFRTEQNAAAEPGDVPTLGSRAVRLDPDLGFDPAHGERGVMDIAVFPGPPETGGESPSLGDPSVVDIKVGEVIGDAIFASEFFDDLMATRLTTEAEEMSEAQWRASARKRINDELDLRVRRTLVVERARSDLSPQQRQGLQYFLDQVQGDLLSRNRGSESNLARTLQEERGQTIEEVMDEEEAMILYFEEQRRIRQGVQVSSADVEREYELNYGSYNYGEVTLRVIRVDAGDTEAIDLVTRQLASGEPFETVARLPENGFRADEGGLWERSYRGDWESAAIVGDDPADPRNVAIRALTRGATSPPVELDRYVYWYHCVERSHTSFSLAEAQRHIENKLLSRRMDEALDAYFRELIQEASVTRLDHMSDRLFDYAYKRFYLPVARAREEAQTGVGAGTGGR